VELLVQARHRLETMLTAEFLPKLNWSLPIFYLFYLQHQFNGCLYKILKKKSIYPILFVSCTINLGILSLPLVDAYPWRRCTDL
jgi:hypothetical protein